MFKKPLGDKLIKIFGIKKVTFGEPSTSNEQEIMFVNIQKTTSKVNDKKVYCRASGQITIYAFNENLPFGFFSKKIELGKKIDCKDLFFYNIDENVNYLGAGNLREATASFIYFYNEDFNPSKGAITQIEFE